MKWRCATLGLVLVWVALATQVTCIDLATLHTKRMGEWVDGPNRVYIHTCYGIIPVRLLRDNAPLLTAKIYELAEKNSCPGCTFYRAEARHKGGGDGPPYGLLQGNLDIGPVKDREGSLTTKVGHVAMIPDSEAFFIALDDHTSWGTSHIVWGVVEDWFAVDMIAAQDYHEVTHDSGTVMRMLNNEFKFRPSTSQEESAAPA